jgi:uncharacterized cupredoxin-like copper-binding protein
MALVACGGEEATTSPTPVQTEVSVRLSEWVVEPSISSVRPGEVEFTATNDGTIEHELIVMWTELAHDALVVVSGQVDEDASGSMIGEIEPEELQPGQTSSSAWTLELGKYVLFCNISGHYANGMHTEFTVN